MIINPKTKKVRAIFVGNKHPHIHYGQTGAIDYADVFVYELSTLTFYADGWSKNMAVKKGDLYFPQF